MCKLGLVLLFSLITGSNYAQGYFVLLQSGNRQPFYVRLGAQVYSSTPNGHLILSQLKDSTYAISIGFHTQPGVEQTYSLAASQKDQEFEIRDRGEAGWGLYDAQTQSWLTAISRSGGREEVKAIGVRRDDAFSRMMAGVVHDTAVLYNDYASLELATRSVVPATAADNRRDTATAVISLVDTPAIKPEAVAVATQPKTSTPAARPDSAIALQAKTDTPAARPDSAIALRPKTDTPATQPIAAVNPDTPTAKAPAATASTGTVLSAPPPAPAVVKLSERKLTKNLRLVYADKGNGIKSDTVVVMIPLDTPQAAGPKLRLTDSARIATAKSRINDSTRVTAAKPKAADSTRIPTTRPKPADSIRAAALKPKAADSARATARTKGPNFDTPNSVRTIVPTPVSQPVDKTRTNDSAKKPATKTSLPYVNSDCHAFATDYDVDKLRVKMLEGAKDEERMAAALKVFKTKCFFTRQLRALSEVFTTDAAKYRFLESAYPFAADEHFKDLITLLADPVYVNKFKVLTGQGGR